MKPADVVVYHDGNGGHFNALVYGLRTDVPELMGTKGEPGVHLVFLDPSKIHHLISVATMGDAIAHSLDVPHLSGLVPQHYMDQYRGWSLSLDPSADAPKTVALTSDEEKLELANEQAQADVVVDTLPPTE